MKLQTRTTLVFLAATIAVFIAGGLLFHHALREIIDEEATENLLLEKQRILDFAEKTGTPPPSSHIGNDLVVVSVQQPVLEIIKDTTVYSSLEEELLPYRQLTFPVAVENNHYAVTVRKLLIESEDLAEAIWSSLLAIAALLLIVLLPLNYFLSRRLWKPFFSTLDKINTYNLNSHAQPAFDKTGVVEFAQLNASLLKMTDRMRADYQNLKNFSENASHEFQTPLAVILAKTEQLLQEKSLPDEQAKQFHQVFQSATRLSRMVKALLLFTKIENNQFAATENMDLSELLREKLDQFAEMIALGNLKTHYDIHPGVKVSIHPALAEILLSNLLSNAIRHNIPNGEITVHLSETALAVANTGPSLPFDPQLIFQRFTTGKPGADSLGLGLALVKEIAGKNNWTVNYGRKDNSHLFIVYFSPQ
ncbi:MAG TPA: HAMP domain-containing sensor histidine kinase [Bacteroidia bacterium]|nr:HAMP domain-containing sensor histidine kinase [Bacteroidia bacterium]